MNPLRLIWRRGAHDASRHKLKFARAKAAEDRTSNQAQFEHYLGLVASAHPDMDPTEQREAAVEAWADDIRNNPLADIMPVGIIEHALQIEDSVPEAAGLAHRVARRFKGMVNSGDPADVEKLRLAEILARTEAPNSPDERRFARIWSEQMEELRQKIPEQALAFARITAKRADTDSFLYRRAKAALGTPPV